MSEVLVLIEGIGLAAFDPLAGGLLVADRREDLHLREHQVQVFVGQGAAQSEEELVAISE